jgi:hypothetical protein
LLRPSEMPKLILTLCQRTSSEYMMALRSEPTLEEMRTFLESAVKPQLQPPIEFEERLRTQIDAVGWEEAMRLQLQERRKRQDKLWEWDIGPPPELMGAHWTSWVAAAICAVLMVWFVYLLCSAPL